MTYTLGSYAPPPSVWEELKQELKTVAPELGIDDIGFASAEPFESLKEYCKTIGIKGMSRALRSPIWISRLLRPFPVRSRSP